jgi:hypothetical protein
MNEKTRDLFERILERMDKINGPKEYCRCENWKSCANHSVMEDVREFLRSEEGEKG